MTKDEIIVLLKEQLQLANEQLQQANATVSSLTLQVGELIERIKSLEEQLVQKGIAIDKANRQNKALGKLVSGKKSERQDKNPQDSMSQEEFDKKQKEQAEKRKARKNNGAKRDMHCEMEEVHVTIDPEMDAELLKKLRIYGTRTCVRYSMEPIKFIKTVYHINTYTDGNVLYPGKTPPALLLNSSYTSSFAAGLLQLRYIYSMPVERIIKYFADNGFTLRKATANKLIARSADVLENIYKAIRQTVLQQDYVTADETYHKVLLAKIKPTDKGSKKGYLWAVSAPKLGLVFFVYEDGSRSEEVILDVFSDYKGTIQSDAYAPYRKLESDVYPDIMRIACLQHIKRNFIDCGKEDKDAQEVVDLINKFYQKDKKHKVGVKGAVWVARMVPDGYVCAHANQARITTFPLEGKTSISSDQMKKIYDKEITTVYAKDVISFAKQKGLYPQDGKNADFSFSDTYAPVDFSGARACEIRVWAFFNAVNPDMAQYWNYAKGKIERDGKGYATNRMPLWVKPNRKVDVLEVMDFMRDHLEGTELDMSKDPGAGPYECPYRWRPMSFEVDGKEYVHERATATQQTGFTFVSQSRSWLPDAVGGILWFGVDDAASTVYFPMYSCSTRVPHAYAVGNGSMMEFTDQAAFWVFNQVTNFAYTRYNAIHPEIREKQKALESQYKTFVEGIDSGAKALFDKDRAAAIEFLTDFSCNTGNHLVDTWRDFYGYLFCRYMDGNIKTAVPGEKNPKVEQPQLPEWYLRTIIEKAGDKLQVIE